VDLIILGAPGSGKGTQGGLLSTRLAIPKISTGDLLRAAVKDGTALGKKAQGFMDKGLLVPDDVILGLIEEVLRSKAAATGIIMDGFPRTLPQAEAVDRLLNTPLTPPPSPFAGFPGFTPPPPRPGDAAALARLELQELAATLRTAQAKITDRDTRAQAVYLLAQIDRALNPPR